jgi:hypothetical protein
MLSKVFNSLYFERGGRASSFVFLALGEVVGEKTNVLDRAAGFYTDAQLVYIRNKTSHSNINMDCYAKFCFDLFLLANICLSYK